MKPLTKTQMDYALSRLEGAAANLRSAALREHKDHVMATYCSLAVVRNPYTPTADQKMALIADGTAKMKAVPPKSQSVFDWFEFPPSPEELQWEAEAEASLAALKARFAVIEAEQQATMDKLYLSGAEDALTAVNAFAAK